MNCHQFESRLNELMDERLTLRDDDSLNLHSQRCQSCRRKLHDFELLRSYFGENKGESRAVGVRQNLVDTSPASSDRFSWREEGRWLLAAVAAALLAATMPLVLSKRVQAPLSIAQVPLNAKTTLISTSDDSTSTELPWPTVLSTLEALPKQLDNLGPVYFCTAHLTGVSSLTSSLSLTVDLLRTQFNNFGLPKPTDDNSQGRRFEIGFDEQLA